MADPRLAHIFVGVQIRGQRDTRQLIGTLESRGFPCLD